MAQERFGRHHDERFAEIAFHLAAERMEEVRWGRDVGDLHVVFGAGLEEAFEASRRVFRALAFVAVGQKQDDAAGALPLGFTGADELVDHNLSAIGEVAELGFPDAEHLGVIKGVAVVEAENRDFGEQGIVNAEAGGRAGDIFERCVFLGRLGVVEDGVAVGEGAAFAILAAEADRRALGEEGAEGESFAEAPVDRAAFFVGGDAAIKEALDFGVNLKRRRDRGETLDDTFDGGSVHAGGNGGVVVAGLENSG